MHCVDGPGGGGRAQTGRGHPGGNDLQGLPENRSDAIAAVFFAYYLRAGSATEALSRAASSIFGVLKRTADAGAREILLVEAQDEFVNPSRIFEPENI